MLPVSVVSRTAYRTTMCYPWNPVMISSSSVHIFQEVTWFPITVTERLCLSLNHLLASPLTVYTCVEV